MAPIYILNGVIAFEWALADGMANSFVLAFLVISEHHYRLSWSGSLIVKKAKMNSSTISHLISPPCIDPPVQVTYVTVFAKLSMLENIYWAFAVDRGFIRTY